MGETTIRCSCCGEMVSRATSEFAFTFPDAYAALKPAQRAAPDTFCERHFCAIGPGRLFVRGLLPLKVVDGGETYCIGAWAELAEHDWRMARQMWDSTGNDRVPPFPGVLANELPRLFEDSTRGLEVLVQLHDATRPTFRLVDTHHPLEDEQRAGITAHRALQFTALAER